MAKIYQGRPIGSGEWKWYTQDQVDSLGGTIQVILSKTIPDAVDVESVTVSAPADVAPVAHGTDAPRKGGRPKKVK